MRELRLGDIKDREPGLCLRASDSVSAALLIPSAFPPQTLPCQFPVPSPAELPHSTRDLSSFFPFLRKWAAAQRRERGFFLFLYQETASWPPWFCLPHPPTQMEAQWDEFVYRYFQLFGYFSSVSDPHPLFKQERSESRSLVFMLKFGCVWTSSE